MESARVPTRILPTYKQLEGELRRARDANRRRDLYVKYIYSMRPYPQDPKTAEFVLDAEEEGVNKSNVGDIYKTTNPNYLVRFNDFQADEEFVSDQWGLWLTANAPIRDAQQSRRWERLAWMSARRKPFSA